MFGSKDSAANGSARVGTDPTPADRPYGTAADADVTARMAGTPTVDGTPAQHAATTEPGMVGAAADRRDRGGVDAPGERDRGTVDRLRDRDGDGVADRSETRTAALPRHDGSTDAPADRSEGSTAVAGRDRDGDGVDDRTETHTITTTRRGQAHAELEAMGVKPAKTSAAAAFALVFGLSALFSGLTGVLAPLAVVLGVIALVLGIAGRKMGRRPGVTGRGVATGGLVTGVLGLLLGLVVLGGLAVYVQQNGLDSLQQRIDDARNNLPTGAQVVDQVR